MHLLTTSEKEQKYSYNEKIQLEKRLIETDSDISAELNSESLKTEK